MSTEVEFAAVLAKARELALAEGTTEPWRIINAARGPLGLDFASDRYDPDLARAEDKYKNQVRRALASLAADGTLVKVGTGNRAEYRTPAEHARLQRDHDEVLAKRRAFEERLAAQRLRLAALGIGSRITHSHVQLDPDALDALMDLAARGLQP